MDLAEDCRRGKRGERVFPSVVGEIGGQHQIGRVAHGIGKIGINRRVCVVIGKRQIDRNRLWPHGAHDAQRSGKRRTQALNAAGQSLESMLIDRENGRFRRPRRRMISTQHLIVGVVIELITEELYGEAADYEGRRQ